MACDRCHCSDLPIDSKSELLFCASCHYYYSVNGGKLLKYTDRGYCDWCRNVETRCKYLHNLCSPCAKSTEQHLSTLQQQMERDTEFIWEELGKLETYKEKWGDYPEQSWNKVYKKI